MIHDTETERAVLGCVLSGSKPSETGLPPEAFTEARRYVWEAMQALETDRMDVDCLTVADRLKARGRLHECGGVPALMEMTNGVAMTWNLPSYVAILIDRMERRAGEAAGETLIAQSRDLSSVPAKAKAAAIHALSNERDHGEEAPDVDVAELSAQWLAWAERLEQGGPRGLDDGMLLATGIEALDAACEGVPSNLCVWLGLASMGKTALAAEIIMNWLKGDVGGGIIGLEDGTKWLTRRHLARHLSIPVKKIGRTLLHDYQQERLQQYLGWASDCYRRNLRIHRAGGLHASELLAIIRRWIGDGVGYGKHKKKCRWVWIDHGLRVDFGTPDQKRYDLAIGKTLEALAALGEANGVTINVNWHLNRTSDQETLPDMKQAKESGYLEAAARWMFAAWEQKQKRPGMMLGTALKVTEGPRDWTVALERDPEYALVKSTGGYPVDFAAEASEERQRADDARKQKTEKRPKLWENES